jgi:outer membrane receptor protein involved in Fe transport
MAHHRNETRRSRKTVSNAWRRSPVSAAVLLALHVNPGTASAQQLGTAIDSLGEVLVTASRRQQSTEEVPYSIAVVNPDRIANTGVTDLADLTRQVPGVSMIDTPRRSGTVFPIIRGLNASPGAGDFRTFEQTPVGVYIGDSPIDGFFQLDDVERIEVLRGPQGTLYGAGALGGAIRIIPTAPQLASLESKVEARVGTIVHASEPSYAASAMINIPVGETLAFRATASYEDLAGFVDVAGIFELDDDGKPALADPSDPIGSSGIVYTKVDSNFQETFTGRASLFWQPTDAFTAQLAYLYSDLEGFHGPTINPAFEGGPFVGDPRIILPPGGRSRFLAANTLAYERETDLASLDMSYDFGFATLTSTTSYATTDGVNPGDFSYSLYRFPQYLGYYAGNPLNPRFIFPYAYTDKAKTFSQEVRLVSNSAPEALLDYVVGLFYQDQNRDGQWIARTPGSPERAQLQGCTGAYYLGSTFPNCMPQSGPNDLIIDQNDQQEFENRSIYGELTWHATERTDVTAGLRYFETDFVDRQSLDLYAWGIFTPADTIESPASDVIWKLGVSQEYLPEHHWYALWSQGFRRGGANAVPLEGPFADNPDLRTYDSDFVDNYEIGVKGHFENGLSYAFDVFYILWDSPQVGGTTPTTNFAVWNANEAVSQGFELDLTAPIGNGFTLSLGGAYADAAFSEDYLIPSSFGPIVGRDGEQLPLSPKYSAAVTLEYDRNLANGASLNVSLNDTYRSSMTLSTFPVINTPPAEAEEMNIVNAAVTISRDDWSAGLYVTNLTDEYIVLQPGAPDPLSNDLYYNTTISRPREIFLRLGYSF